MNLKDKSVIPRRSIITNKNKNIAKVNFQIKMLQPKMLRSRRTYEESKKTTPLSKTEEESDEQSTSINSKKVKPKRYLSICTSSHHSAPLPNNIRESPHIIKAIKFHNQNLILEINRTFNRTFEAIFEYLKRFYKKPIPMEIYQNFKIGLLSDCRD
jgi:hypothetical protein